jgi:hypothetical protein
MSVPTRSPTSALPPLVALLVAGLGCQPLPTLSLGADPGAAGIDPAVRLPDADLADAAAADGAPAPADASAPSPPPSTPPPTEDPVATAVVPGDWSPPDFCHDLAPAAGTVVVAFFAGVCPSASELHGGRILDGIYRVVRPEICLSTPGTFETQPVRIRISGGGTRLDWSSDRPIFSARIGTAGATLELIETCRDTQSGDRPQPPYQQQFSVSGDELTLYTGLSSLVFRREP